VSDVNSIRTSAIIRVDIQQFIIVIRVRYSCGNTLRSILVANRRNNSKRAFFLIFTFEHD
jgi:hypothetical protein